MMSVIFAGILLCFVANCDGTRCFECNNVQFPRDCTQLTTCSPDENCFTEQVVTASGNVIFNTGCLSKSRCSISSSPLIGRRTANAEAPPVGTTTSFANKRFTDVRTCRQCCTDDLCNRKGCGAHEIPFEQRGPYCFTCDVLDPKACSAVAVCAKDELCMINTPGKFSSLTKTMYRMQCETQAVCGALSRAYNNNKCVPMCCNTDFCNDACVTPPNVNMTTSYQHTGYKKTTKSLPAILITYTTSAQSTMSPALLTTTTISAQSTVPPALLTTSTISAHSTVSPALLTTTTISAQSTVSPATLKATTTSEQLSMSSDTLTRSREISTSKTNSHISTKHSSTPLSTTSSRTLHCHHDGFVLLHNAHAQLCIHVLTHHDLLSWKDAQTSCKKRSGDLVVLDTHDKALLLRKELERHSSYNKFDLFWIGAKDFNHNNHFSWVDGQALDNSEADWSNGQPDHTAHGHQQDCVSMTKDGNPAFRWHDRSCNVHGSFICERK